jgi:hypothetical protein
MYEHHTNGGARAVSAKHKVHDVLLEVDGWRLVRPLYPNLIERDSYIVHWDCDGGRKPGMNVKKWTNKGGIGMGSICTKCGEKCPDEIIGLEILHNGGI